jgi:pheromone shutdown-related protein TraB
VIKEKKASLLLSNLILASFQKRIGKKLGIKPGEEILRAIEAANGVDARLHLADRDIRITLSRLWRSMRLWTKVKLLFQVIASSGEVGELTEEDIEKMKKRDVLEMLLSELGQSLPEVRRVLIDERDQYLAHKIRTSPGGKTVAVVGAGHVPGIQRYWKEPIDIEELEKVPPKGKSLVFIKWGFPIGVLGLIAFGFFMSGSGVAVHMIKWWILANGILAGLGAAVALAHPLTILTAVAASPLTSLNPMIAAGWVAGLVEVFLGKPKVIDFENLTEDVSSVKGFWKNKITRILLVVVFTNMGSSFGTFVAIPLMLRVLA